MTWVSSDVRRSHDHEWSERAGGPGMISPPVAGPGQVSRSAVRFAANELLDRLARGVVAVLLGWGFHEVRRGGQERPADAAVLGDLGGADGVDDHACRVRRITDLQLVLEVERHVAERAPLQPALGALAVVVP